MSGDGGDARTRFLAQAVRRRRKGLGLTQEQLADLAGCSERFVYAIESGRATLRLDKVLDVLGVLGLGLTVGFGEGHVSAVALARPEDGSQ